MKKIDIYKYYRGSGKMGDINLSNLNEEQYKAFTKWIDKNNIQQKINYLQTQYNNIKSLNTMSPLYRECKAQHNQTDTLIRIESEIKKLERQLKELEES